MAVAEEAVHQYPCTLLPAELPPFPHSLPFLEFAPYLGPCIGVCGSHSKVYDTDDVNLPPQPKIIGAASRWMSRY